MEFFIHIFVHTLEDTIKLLPFLFITYLIMEYFEHKVSDKNKNFIKKTGKLGPLFGAILGIFPQCGFSAAAANLYSNRLITIGTMFAIFLSTSDEMLPIFISEGVSGFLILKILIIKLIISIFFGFLIDIFLHIFNKKKSNINNSESSNITKMCEHEHCGCNNGIFLSSLKHTLNIYIYILFITFILNLLFEFIGKENISNFITINPFLGPILSGLIGLIPNCASSVVLTQLYLSNSISVSTLLSGLLVNSGVGLLVLFKSNKNLKNNIFIIALLYLIGIICGIFLELIGLQL